MQFFSDNSALVHPKIMEAIAKANHVDAAYGADKWSAQLNEKFGEIFGAEIIVHPVSTGTAANCLALAAMTQPYQGILCHEEAHIVVDECGAPGFFTAGAQIIPIGGDGAKINPHMLTHIISAIRDDVHQVQPACLSITNASEYGMAYTPSEIRELADIIEKNNPANNGRRQGKIGLHVDGARFANVVAMGNYSAAELTHLSGVDALSFGCIKNGGMNAEALIFFNTDLAKASEYRRKRAGHLHSKGRFMAAQLLAMIEDDLWLENAHAANHAAQIIASACGDRLLYPVQVNEIFLRLTADEAQKLRNQGFDFYDWGVNGARLVTSWHHSPADVTPLANAISDLGEFQAS
ncbi:low specificity L-threonine aldolase [Sphingorhabdus lutea]|uniref:Low specificity L-threonine aldolase n=1 Tax=Sphingorhabdus lutea TaxID=1913578 RepID=A0A1L3JEN7_9SPHN|nr:beta-eliminating lyase-related protein [Sphingorhabdus lutea]APG63608.1 low specificity L-threonine aldolase [Sphingorhabdus lutea]